MEADTGCSSTCSLSFTFKKRKRKMAQLWRPNLFPLLILGGEEEDESEDRLRHKTQKIRIKTPHIDYFPLGGNPTKVAKGTQHLKW